MVSIEKGAWAIVMVIILVALGIFINDKLADTATENGTSYNWSTNASIEFTNNASLIGLIFLLVLVGGAFVYIRQIRK